MASDSVDNIEKASEINSEPKDVVTFPAAFHPLSVSLLPAASAEGGDGAHACQFFLKGKCRFGPRCRLSHSAPSIDDSGPVALNQDDKEEETEKHHMKRNESEKPEHDAKVGNKKPRMRTADDVISRILWDSAVDSSKFVVGYVDRFLGVLERPFDDFTWDINPSDCDYSAELALPRHRIQYFIYRGHRVWDRHTRTDRVFGSTGQSLAPPFGKKKEVKDEQQEKETAEERQEEDVAEERPQTENTHVEEEKPRKKNTDTLNSTQSAGKCSRNTCLEEGTRVTAEDGIQPEAVTPDLMALALKAANAQDEGPLAALEPNMGCSKDDLRDPDAVNVREVLLEPKEKSGGRPPRKRPTHFVCFRANTPAILSGFQQLQDEVTALLPTSAPHWSTSSSLHVTMCLLTLSGPAEVAAAGEVLRQFAQLDRNPPVVLTFPLRLKHFNGRVLYLSPQPHLHLQQLNGGLQEAYRKEGWLHRHSYNPRYHLTLAKTNYTEEERIFERVGDLKVGKGLNFGRLPVNTLHLCTIGGDAVDGFYETLCTVKLR
ncbi:leukocyte receptor cluster member 9 isoform X2 [Takifugu rubripes]|uniref:leukocyte receptor cluster member 9 isoform X2 n=1 Tax=Takifugu rubripes TaxID=31033 RepID=UPI0011454E03|nr:leukocyte receptor cluster member 9 isoform X2 [Takifugu rubripes]